MVINALLALGFAHDFTAPRDSLGDVHPLTLVRAIAERVVGGELVLLADPIVELLPSAELEELERVEQIVAAVTGWLDTVLGPDLDASAVVRRPGGIDVVDHHLDVTMTLDDLPIELRLAGLDRDPGWLPAGGCHLMFHFTCDEWSGRG